MAEGDLGRRRNSRVSRYGPRPRESSRVCKFYSQGNCYYGDQCRFLHIDINHTVFQEDQTSSEQNHSCTPSQRKMLRERKQNKSISESTEKLNLPLVSLKKRGMEASVAIQRSKDKACGICYEFIVNKNKGERKFGILSNCNHCFCLACIRKWRRAHDSDFDHNITRNCPECRVASDFVCPSFYWVESKEEKEKLISDYKEAMREKDCKYFRTRNGRCPFGDKCFYKHTYPTNVETCNRRQTVWECLDWNFETSERTVSDFLGVTHDSDSDFESYGTNITNLFDANQHLDDSACLIL